MQTAKASRKQSSLSGKESADTVSTVSPSIFHEVMGPDAMILVFLILSFTRDSAHRVVRGSSRGRWQGLVPLRWGCALPSPNALGKAPNHIQKTKIMASGPITSWKIDGETVETVSDFIFLQNWETDSWRAQTETCVFLQEKGAVTPQETDPDLPMSVQESPAVAYVGSGLLQG